MIKIIERFMMSRLQIIFYKNYLLDNLNKKKNL